MLAIYWYSPPEKSNTLRTKQSNGGKNYHPTRGNPGKTCKSSGIPEKYPGSTSRSPYGIAIAIQPGPLCQLRRDPPAQVCAPHHVLPLQVPESGRGAAPGTACGADDAAVPTFIFKIEAVLGMRFCDPSSSLQRSGAISWLLPTRPFATSRAASAEVQCGHDEGYTDTTAHCGSIVRRSSKQQMRQLPS